MLNINLKSNINISAVDNLKSLFCELGV